MSKQDMSPGKTVYIYVMEKEYIRLESVGTAIDKDLITYPLLAGTNTPAWEDDVYLTETGEEWRENLSEFDRDLIQSFTGVDLGEYFRKHQAPY